MSILDSIGGTPCVELKSFETSVPVYGKCEHLNPGGSIKDRLALALVAEGEKTGKLKPGQTIVEATAGNTGLGLAMVAAAKDYKVVCVLPEKMSVDKRRALRAVGAEVLVTANAPLDDPRNFRNVAKRLSQERGWYLANQFCSQANVEAHRTKTGPELLQAFPEGIGAFVCGVGTGGTITGVAQFMKERDPAALIVLADPVGSSLAGWVNNDGVYGADGKYLVEGIGSSRATDLMDRKLIDLAISVDDETSYATALQLHKREGLYVGGSSGTTVAAAVELARRGLVAKPIVAILGDSWDRYMSQDWLCSPLSF